MGALLFPVVADAVVEEPITLSDLGYRLERWTVDDGMPSNHVTSVARAGGGFLWVGTRDGVARFDGNRFERFSSRGHPALAQIDPRQEKDFLHVVVDGAGGVWAMPNTGGLASFSGGAFERVAVSAEGGEGAMKALGEGPGGAFWWCLERPGQKQEWLSSRGVSFEPVAEACRGVLRVIPSGEAYWAISIGVPTELIKLASDGGSVVERVRMRGQKHLRDAEFSDLFRDQDGNVYAYSDIGLMRLVAGSWEWICEFDEVLGRGSARIDGSGNIWIASLVLRVFTPDGKLGHVELPAPPALGFPVLADVEGSVWLGTRAGLYQIVPSAFVTWEVAGGVDGRRGQVFSVSEDGEGTLWFAGENDLLYAEPGASRLGRIETGVGAQRWSVVGSPRSGAYLRMGPRVEYWSRESRVGRPVVDGWGNMFNRDRDGVLWSSDGAGLLRYDEVSGQSEALPFEGVEGGLSIEHMAQDRHGRIYLAIRGKGLCLFEPDNRVRILTPHERGEGKRPATLHADGAGGIWLGSYGPMGLGLWDVEAEAWSFAEFEQLNLPFPLAKNFGVCTDTAGGFWLSTVDRGVWRAPRDELAAAVQAGGGGVGWKVYDRKDGLATAACSFHAKGMLVDSRERLWVATDLGVSSMNPAAWDRVRAAMPAPEVMVLGASIDGVTLAAISGERVEVLPGGRRLELSYAALHLANPDRVRFRYRMEGLERDWNDGGNRRSAVYQSVPPGRYTFRVTADNGFGKWSETGASLAVVFMPHWWERAWVVPAAGGMVLLLLGVVFMVRARVLGERLRLRELATQKVIETQERERKRIAQEIHDGVGQDLLVLKTQIAIEAAAAGEGGLKREVAGEFEGMLGESLEALRRVAHDLRPYQIDRLGLTRALEAVVSRFEQATGLEVASEIDDVDGVLPEGRGIHVLRIVQEALNNALKHADASQVRVVVERRLEGFEVLVEDDGRGFEMVGGGEACGEAGLGLHSMSERARMVGGLLRVKSEVGSGTVVRLVVGESDG